MKNNPLSRRRFLHSIATFGAGLGGFFLASRGQALQLAEAQEDKAEPQPKAEPVPTPNSASAPIPSGSLTTYCYDAHGTLVGVKRDGHMWTYRYGDGSDGGV